MCVCVCVRERERVARILIAGTIISTEMTYIIDESELDLLNPPTWIATLVTNASIYSRMMLNYLNVRVRKGIWKYAE